MSDPIAKILREIKSDIPIAETVHIDSKLTSDTTTKAYHIILDCDYNSDDKIFNHPVMFGKVRKSGFDDYISVLFDFEATKRLAGRMVDQAVIAGTMGNKQHPVFGAIIIGLELKGKIYNEGNIDGDYSKLGKEDGIVIYESKDRDKTVSKRGLVPKSILSKSKIVSKTYVSFLEVPVPVGFALFNLDPTKTPDTIKELKKIHKESMQREGEELFLSNLSHDSSIRSDKLRDPFNADTSDVNYELLAAQEKEKYARLKKIALKMGLTLPSSSQSVSSAEQYGGAPFNQHVDYEILASQKKAEYIRLKKIALKMGVI